MENEFLVTLISNASANYHPDNTTSSFSVHLAKEINLDGKWMAALTEVAYPNLFYNVTKGNSCIIVQPTMVRLHYGLVKYKEMKIDIGVGSYQTIGGLVKKINEAFSEYFKGNLFKPEESIEGGMNGSEKVKIREEVTKLALDYYKLVNEQYGLPTKFKQVPNSDQIESVSIKLEGRLAIQLGFPPSEDLVLCKQSIHQPNLNAGIPAEMFCYVDIVEPQLIGDASSQVMRIVKTIDDHNVSNSLITHEFLHRNYMPLVKNRFQSVKVELRDAIGQLLPFQFGTSSVTLHFKKSS